MIRGHCGHTLWTYIVDIHCGHTLWTYIVDIHCGHTLWTYIVDIHCGHTLWTYIVFQCYFNLIINALISLSKRVKNNLKLELIL